MFRWRKTIHIGVLGIYPRELPAIEDEYGNVLYETIPGLPIPESLMSGVRGIKFLIIKLDILNRDDSIDNLLTNREARLILPKNIKTKIVPLHHAYVNKEDLKELYSRENDYENLIEDLDIPLRLKPGITYTRHICLELALGAELVEEGKVEIIITDRHGKKLKIMKNFPI